MKIDLQTILYIYFIPNIFFAGRQFESVYQGVDSTKEGIIAGLDLLIVFIIGWPLYVVITLCSWTNDLIRLLQIKALFQIYIQGKMTKLSQYDLEVTNRFTKNKITGKSIRHRMWRLVQRIINKKNNYTP